jgi:hypothetical protein
MLFILVSMLTIVNSNFKKNQTEREKMFGRNLERMFDKASRLWYTEADQTLMLKKEAAP